MIFCSGILIIERYIMNVYEILEKLNIKYEEWTHNAVYTMEEAINIKNRLKGLECKNLFLKSKDNYFLLVIEGDKKANLKEIEKLLNIKRLTFASEDELMNILNLTKGSVTPLGLINDKEKIARVLIDKNLKDNKLLVHPNINTKTISIEYIDLIKFIDYTEHKYIIF